MRQEYFVTWRNLFGWLSESHNKEDSDKLGKKTVMMKLTKFHFKHFPDIVFWKWKSHQNLLTMSLSLCLESGPLHLQIQRPLVSENYLILDNTWSVFLSGIFSLDTDYSEVSSPLPSSLSLWRRAWLLLLSSSSFSSSSLSSESHPPWMLQVFSYIIYSYRFLFRGTLPSLCCFGFRSFFSNWKNIIKMFDVCYTWQFLF